MEYWAVLNRDEFMERFGLSVKMCDALESPGVMYEIILDRQNSDPTEVSVGDLFISIFAEGKQLKQWIELFGRCSNLYAGVEFLSEVRLYIYSSASKPKGVKGRVKWVKNT